MGEEEASNKPTETEPDDLPDAPAFDDAFTRNFLQSTAETEKGFYPFLSGTGKYKLDFPTGGVIDNRMYSVKDDEHEEVTISIEDDTGISMHLIYYSDHTEKRLPDDLKRFKKRLGYDDEFEKLMTKDSTLYYSHYERNGFRTYVGYMLNAQNSGGIELIYKIDCRDEKKEVCKRNKQSDKERAMKWLESVEFINESDGNE